MSKQIHLVNHNLPSCFKALANPVRFEIYIKILEEACDCNLDVEEQVWGNCVSKIADDLEVGQPTVSNHVKELINCGLVITEKRERNIYLFGNPELAKDFANFSEFMQKEIEGHD